MRVCVARRNDGGKRYKKYKANMYLLPSHRKFCQRCICDTLGTSTGANARYKKSTGGTGACQMPES